MVLAMLIARTPVPLSVCRRPTKMLSALSGMGSSMWIPAWASAGASAGHMVTITGLWTGRAFNWQTTLSESLGLVDDQVVLLKLSSARTTVPGAFLFKF